jgi:acyl-CoA carboxylase subunit alpha
VSVRRLLIANRGEIACRIIRSARKLGISTVAVYGEPDVDALHVAMADEAVPLGGAAPSETYLHAGRLLSAARVAGADAVHPGYGFLAEDAAFARACLEAGLVWVGPDPAVIEAMADKLRAKEVMRAAGVPVVEEVTAPPLLVKAVAGGGGRGMRVVDRSEDLEAALDSARREAQAAFGDGRVFTERYLSRARHVEVQLLGDAHGNLVVLGERECSIQRRHQKVIEETPSPAVDARLRARLFDAALAAGYALRYRGAGTVEFLLDTGERGVSRHARSPGDRFAFCEVNTRLQVEHPVTELAWGIRDRGPLDLVAEQLRIARGEPLGFGQDDVELRSWAVEARLYAEDPAAGFLPAIGRLDVWRPADGLRVDSGVREGTVVGVDYDPLLAKFVASGSTRDTALDVLAAGLERSWVAGVVTNRDLLVAVLRSPAFRAGETPTSFLDDHRDALLVRDVSDERRWWHAAAAALAGARRRRQAAPVLRTLPSGWRNNPSQPQGATFLRTGEGALEVAYQRQRDGAFQVSVAGDERTARVLGGEGEEIDLQVGLLRRRVAVVEVADRVHVHSALGSDTLRALPRLPVAAPAEPAGSLLAPMPGRVTRVEVSPGASVTKGDVLVVLEAMKMEHPVDAPHDGTVTEVRVSPGQLVSADDILAVVEPR